MRNIFKYIPMVTLGQILGTAVFFPLLCFLIAIFYYSNKYNDDAEQYYEDYMNNPAYGTKENPVPVLKDIGVDESIRDYEKDYDKAYMDSFYRENVIRYLKYKMPKSEFKRRFKN